MKKLLVLLISCVMIFCLAGCSSCGDVEPETGDGLPSVPDGVELPDVKDDDIVAILSGFRQKYADSDNMYLDYYKSYTNGTATGSVRYEGKIYGDNASGANYKNALGDMGLDVYGQTGVDGEREPQHLPMTVRLRGEKCSVVTNGTLTAMYTEGYHRMLSPMDYMAELADSKLFSGELADVIKLMQESDRFTAEVNADGNKLYADIAFDGEEVKAEYRFYLDTAAGYSAADFGSGTPASYQIDDIRYYTTDLSEFLADFMGGKEIKLYPSGYGDVEKLIGPYKNSLTVNYIYDGKSGNTNLNIGFYGGELYIPDTAFEVLCNKIDSKNFDLNKLTVFYFEIEIIYEEDNKVCESLISIDY